MRYVAILPTLITLGNGVFGLLAIYEGLQGSAGVAGAYERAAWLILIAMVFDGLDGKVARATRSTTAFGGQLDSLCDAISFGVAPSVLTLGLFAAEYAPTAAVPEMMKRVLVAVSLFYACAVLVRLARFNVETAQDEASHQKFSGLPSPGAGGMVASWVITYFTLKGHVDWGWAAHSFLAALPVAAFALGLLMVSTVRYTSFKNLKLHGRQPLSVFVVAVLLLSFAIAEFELFLFTGISLYVLSGPVMAIVAWRGGQRAFGDAGADEEAPTRAEGGDQG